jgi:RNA polymerase sigma-70 factor (ECF subfamily)
VDAARRFGGNEDPGLTLREDLNALTPRLRRYARALVSGQAGGSDQADDLVRAALMRALGFRQHGTHADLVVRLYATLILIHRELATPAETMASTGLRAVAPSGSGPAAAPAAIRPGKLTSALMSLPLEDREALLLVALDNFEHGEAARILRISRAAFLARLTRARLALETQMLVRPGRQPGERDRQHSHLRLVK